jgi:hypothetical protein
VLTDTAAWPDWDSGVAKVDGQPTPGEKLSITTKAKPGRAFPVKVVQLNAPERMVFLGGMPLGLFTGQLTYNLVPEGTEPGPRCVKEYTGPIAGMIFKRFPDLTRRSLSSPRDSCTEPSNGLGSVLGRSAQSRWSCAAVP